MLRTETCEGTGIWMDEKYLGITETHGSSVGIIELWVYMYRIQRWNL